MFQILSKSLKKPFLFNQFRTQTIIRLASNTVLTEKNGTENNTLVNKEFPTYDTEQIIKYLRNKEYMRLKDIDFDILRKKQITGYDFLQLTQEELRQFGMEYGPAKRIIQFIKDSNFTARTSTNLVYLFIDNTNLYIGGKYSVGRHENLGSFDQKNLHRFDKLHIDYTELLTTVKRKRKMGSAPMIVGTRSQSNYSLWRGIQKQGYSVTVFDQSSDIRKKEVDMELGAQMWEFIYNSSINPGILVLIAGDRDYKPILGRALDHGWKVEVWFWKKATSGAFKEDVNFVPLDNYYKTFTFGYGPAGTDKALKTLEITGNIGKWTNKEIMNFFIPLGIFAWWHQKDNKTIHLYFKYEDQMELVKNQIEKCSHNLQVKALLDEGIFNKFSKFM